MRKTLLSISIIAIIANLTGCATNPFSPQKENVNSPEVTKSTNTAVGGQIETAMDENDKEKMYRALDKPLGKPTDWVNEKTRISYIVVPTAKLAIKENPFCRKYTVTSISNGNRNEVSGVACVSKTDSSWQEMN